MAPDERPPPLRLVCADELGQLKVVQTADGTQLGTAAVAATWGAPDKLQCIDCIALGSAGGLEDTATAVLAVARRSGAVELLSPLTGEAMGTIPAAPAAPGSRGKRQDDSVRVRGLHLLWGGESTLPSVLTVTQGGAARVHAAPDGAWEEQRGWQVPPQVCCTAYDAASGRLAVGCEGAELRLYDAATGELAFTFKGGKPNMVGLVDKPWNTAVAFLPPAPGGAAGSRLLVGTGHHKVRLYDAEAGKRPQMELAWGETRITCLALEPDGQHCWVGNGLGQVEVLELGARRFSGAIKGLSGSARALAVHPGGEVLATVGLDRYLRLHSVRSRQLLAKVYIKTLPSGMAFCPTDASMLPAVPAPEAAEDGKQRRKKDKQRRRSRAAAEGSDDDGAAGAEESEELSDAEQEEQPRQHRKRSKQQRGGGGRRRHE